MFGPVALLTPDVSVALLTPDVPLALLTPDVWAVTGGEAVGFAVPDAAQSFIQHHRGNLRRLGHLHRHGLREYCPKGWTQVTVTAHTLSVSLSFGEKKSVSNCSWVVCLFFSVVCRRAETRGSFTGCLRC